MTTAIRMTEVSKSFKGIPVLTGVNLHVSEGFCYSVEGPNGSGKSVLFRLMCGFLQPDAGIVEIAPSLMGDKRIFPEAFGVVIDRPGYLRNRTGRENLGALAAIRGTIGTEQIDEAMARVGLDPEAPQKVGAYSLGMKQKLALAQAFMEGQRVLLLDEPFNALDTSAVTQMTSLLRSFLDEGRTIVFSSHHRSEIDSLANVKLGIENRTLVTLKSSAARPGSDG